MLHLDGDSIIEQVVGHRENYIPLHSNDIVDFLAQHSSLQHDDRAKFREVASLILSLLHHLYRQRHQQLNYVYTALDPDRDRILRSVPTSDYRDQLVHELLERTRDVLQRANYRRLDSGDIEEALQAASQWGVHMRLDFDMFSDLEVYARGHVLGRREFRNWRKFFRRESISVPLYQRLVVVFRICEEQSSDQFDCRRVYLRMFKNIPQQDIDMMLPASGIHMTWLDHSKIVVPSLYAAGITLWRFLRNVLLLTFFGVFKTIGLAVLVILAIGFGVKSMFTYRTNTQRRYMLNMTQQLYYQNLDNNAGVLLRLLEEGEQQEAMEAILAYFVTTTQPHSSRVLSLREIDGECERILQEATNMQVDFNVDGSAHLLTQLGLLEAKGDKWQALPLEEAKQRLDLTWDNWFE
jgi:hypothetical protein